MKGKAILLLTATVISVLFLLTAAMPEPVTSKDTVYHLTTDITATNLTMLNQEWNWIYGGNNQELAHSIRETSDGGFIVAGRTESFGAGGEDMWLLKLDSYGSVIWQKTYGGEGDDAAAAIQETDDGGFIVAGSTESFGAGGRDMWLLKLDSYGAVIWQKTYGGAGQDAAVSLHEVTSGGWIIAGHTISFGAGNYDLWILRLDGDGAVTWQKTYGGSNTETLGSIEQTQDGGFIIIGTTYTFGSGNSDAWVLKLGSDGTVVWQKSYGGVDYDYGSFIQETSDGGFIMTVRADSFHASLPNPWILKLNSDGTIAWQKVYDNFFHGGGFSAIRELNSGGFVTTGYYMDTKGGIHRDAWVMKLGSDGTVIWQRTYDTGEWDSAADIWETSDGGFIVAGHSGPKLFFNDIWVLKLNSEGETFICDVMGEGTFTVSETPATPLVSTATVQDTSVTPLTNNTLLQDTPVTATYVCPLVLGSVDFLINILCESNVSVPKL